MPYKRAVSPKKVKQAKHQKGRKKQSRMDKKSRRAIHRKMRKGAHEAIEAGAITVEWLKKYGKCYRQVFHTRNASSSAPDPAVEPALALYTMKRWLADNG